MGEVGSHGVCDKSEQSAALRRDVAGPCEFHCFPHRANNHRGLTLCSCQLLILQAGGTTEDIFSPRCPPLLPPRLISMLQGAVAPITPSLLPVSGPSRGRKTHPTDSFAEGRSL